MSRTLIISNRLPFTVTVNKEGALTFKESAGGLASGLSAYLNSLRKGDPRLSTGDYVWVGWPGITVEDDQMREEVRRQASSDFHAYPVFLSAEEMDNFYLGFCNSTIWPLFHYFPTYAVYDTGYWENYKQVNEAFCAAVMEIARPDDTIWVHDYHLMLLPRLLRERLPDTPIGFFLHIPFPSYEIYRLLPSEWRSEILKGLLGADLIGFHTSDYTYYFLRSILRIMGYEHSMGQVAKHDHVVKAAPFPMGIDFDQFNDASSDHAMQKERTKLLSSIGGLKVVLSIDRLDYTKGIANRLLAYEMFLETHPEWQKKVMLNLLITPSRVEVERYQRTKQQIEELVGRINGRFGSLEWVPIVYQYRFYPFKTLAALYSISHVALVTPLRDGMNLVAKEYVASRTDQTGVLILSEMAGAEKELGEAILINPNSKEEIANALLEALEMTEDEQRRRNAVMQNRLRRYNVVRWAEEFMQELGSIREEQQRLNARLLQPAIREQLVGDYRKARRRLLFLDYDGTLVPFASHPTAATPTEQVLAVLRGLADGQKNEVVLTSGRDKATLENWFGGLNISLVAEHGVWIKQKGKQWEMAMPLTNDWKERLRPILELYADRVPGSFVEEKEYALVWHYRMADLEMGPARAKELLAHLVDYTAKMDVQVVQGSKVIEVKSAGVNKGTTTLRWLSTDDFDFILALGDDWTDEDLFTMLPPMAYTLKVGVSQTNARFNLRDSGEALRLLESLQ